MNTPDNSDGPTPVDPRRVRELRVALGLGTDALARRARLSRTTLHHIEKGTTPHPRVATLKKLAAALNVGVTALLQRSASPSGDSHTPHAFDRRTNPAVDQVLAQRPRLFDRWRDADWQELYSERGMGGALTSEGVVQAATRINRKRQTQRQLAVVLETHLADVAAALIERLYAMVRLPGCESTPD